MIIAIHTLVAVMHILTTYHIEVKLLNKQL